jgi:hypothetical protein
MTGAPFARDPEHWLFRLSPEEWIRAGLNELERAKSAFAARQTAGALACLKRAAGMALNAALIQRPDADWGRTYVEHLKAVAEAENTPAPVRDAARLLVDASVPTGEVVSLRTPSSDTRLLEAARTVMAHAYAIAHGSTGRLERHA